MAIQPILDNLSRPGKGEIRRRENRTTPFLHKGAINCNYLPVYAAMLNSFPVRSRLRDGLGVSCSAAYPVDTVKNQNVSLQFHAP